MSRQPATALTAPLPLFLAQSLTGRCAASAELSVVAASSTAVAGGLMMGPLAELGDVKLLLVIPQ